MGIITKAAKAFNEINWDKVGIFTRRCRYACTELRDENCHQGA